MAHRPTSVEHFFRRIYLYIYQIRPHRVQHFETAFLKQRVAGRIIKNNNCTFQRGQATERTPTAFVLRVNITVGMLTTPLGHIVIAYSA